MDDNLVAANCGFKVDKKPLTVFIVLEDVLSLVAPRRYVIESTGVLDSYWSCHN